MGSNSSSKHELFIVKHDFLPSNFFYLRQHCFDDNIFVDMVSFRGGSANRFMGGKIVHAEQFFSHPQYDASTYNFDVS
jgi:hypothetical protein